MPASARQHVPAPPPERPWLTVVQVVALLFLFLVGVRGLGKGFEALGEDLLQYFFTATANPFAGLVIGILATTLVQSSSVTTSLIVGLVAAPENPLPVAAAVPMVMGANIGTTVTNTLVSLGHIGRPEEFRRAFGAATCHDFFNFIAVAIFLPLELATGILERTAGVLSRGLAGQAGGPTLLPNPLKASLDAVLAPLQTLATALMPGPRSAGLMMILITVAMIFSALYLLVRRLRALMASRLESYLSRSLSLNPHLGLIVGTVVTFMVQSSSITTSILVPLAGAGLVTLNQVFPITLGANIGTTLTALVATQAASGDGLGPALQIALCHTLFNVGGTLVVYPLPVTRQVPIRMAQWLAGVAVRSRRFALLYLVLLFYGIPALLIAVSRFFSSPW